jgi:hypothetical protein
MGEGYIEPTYGRFLELPVAVVLVALWLAGATLMGACASMIYLVGWLLVGVIA